MIERYRFLIRLALLVVVAGSFTASGVVGVQPSLIFAGVLAAWIGVPHLLSLATERSFDGARTLRIGWPAPLWVVALVVHLGLLGALWPLHVALDGDVWGEGARAEEGFWLTAVLAAAMLPLGGAGIALGRSLRKVAGGTPGRMRFLVALHAVAVTLTCEVALTALVWLAQSERDVFELDGLFGESGPLLFHDTLRTIASGQGTLPALLVVDWGLRIAVGVQLVLAISSWFLVPERIRRVFFYAVDGLVTAAFVFALWTLPFSPPEDGPPTLAAIALTITALFCTRALFRVLPLMLDAIERSGFEALVAARLLRARKSGFLTVISSLSILAVSFSSCTLTTTLSVMGGFRDDLRQKIVGDSAHVVVDREYGSWEGWDPVLERVRAVPGVVGASPYIEGEVMITSASNLGGVVLRGIDPETIVTELPSELRHGRMEYLSHPELLLDLSPEEMSGSVLDRIEPTPVPPRDAGTDAPAAATPDAGVEIGGREPDHVGLSREIDSLLDTLDRELGPSEVSVPLAEPAPELPAGEYERAARLEELDEFLLPEAPEARHRRERALDLLPGIIVGAELARSLRLHVGDEVNVVSPNGELGPTGPMPRSRPFRVAGIFYSGMFEYDMQLAYTDLATAQRFLGLGGAVTGLQVRVDDWERAEERATAIAAVVGRSELRVRSWQEVNRNLFGALQLEKLAMFIMLLLAILVASFCVVGALMLMVQEKGKEVAILKAMGAEDRQVIRMFLVQGLLIGFVGALSGCGLGYLACFGAEHLGIAMDPEVYYIDRLPVHVEPLDFVAVGVSAVVVCLIATIYPAILGSRLRPLDGIRQS